MKRALNSAALLCLVTALVLGIVTNQDVVEESELTKSFRDPDRVDQRWLIVTGLGTAGACFALWSMNEKRR